jgi:uncharacterized protein (UPF0305 family)
MSKKDNVRDYVVSMFRFYSNCGKPDTKQIVKLKTQLSTAAILDLMAVDNMLCQLERKGKHDIVQAINEIYFFNSKRDLKKNEISQRVQHYSSTHFIEERTVWRWLKSARKLCAEYRNLNIL